MSDSKTEEYTIEFEQPVNFKVPTWRGDRAQRQALSYVQSIRDLGDPNIVPVALVKTTTMTVTDVEKITLRAWNEEDITRKVRERLLAMKGVAPDGEDGLSWAVRQTIREITDGN